MAVQIPLTAEPNQRFIAQIPASNGNLTLGFYLSWNRMAEYWMLDLFNPLTQAEYLTSLALVQQGDSRRDFMSQYGYLNLGSAYLVPLTQSAPAQPGLLSWGTDYAMIWDASAVEV